MGPTLRKPLSRRNFVMNITLYNYTLKTTTLKQSNIPQNGGQITHFRLTSFQFWQKFQNPLSQGKFSMKFGS